MEKVRGGELWVGGLHWKGTLSCESFTISRNWLILGGAVSLSLQTLKDQSMKKQKIKRHERPNLKFIFLIIKMFKWIPKQVKQGNNPPFSHGST